MNQPGEKEMKRLIALILTPAVISCGDPAEPEPPYPARVVVSPDSSLVEAMAWVDLDARVYDQYDSLMKANVQWSSEDTAIAVVDGAGRVTGVTAGEVLIWAKVEEAAGAAQVDVEWGQRALLRIFYESLNGDDWRNNRAWLTDAPLRNWHGLRVNENGDVTHIILVQNNLSGTIPPEIGLLAHLGEINLGNNEIGGSIPPELGNLVELTELRLAANKLTGGLSERLVDPPNLWGIDLQQNELTGAIPASWLEDHETLEGILLDNNQLTGPLPPAGDLPAMRIFLMSGNRLTGEVPPSYGDVAWAVLDFNNNQLEGELPFELMNTSPTIFSWNTNDTLCSPADEDFREWLNNIPFAENGPECESDGP